MTNETVETSDVKLEKPKTAPKPPIVAKGKQPAKPKKIGISGTLYVIHN